MNPLYHHHTYTIMAARAVLTVCLLAFLTTVVAASPAEVRDTVKRSFDVRPGGTLHLDMDFGNIEVETIQGSRVLIEVERIADTRDEEDAALMLEQHELDFDQSGSDVTLRSRYNRGDEDRRFRRSWRGHNLKVRVLVQVPARYNVDFTSGAGNIDIVEVEGFIEGQTGAGNIHIDDVRGRIDISSGAGNIEVAGDIEEAKVNTGAGNIELYGLTGAVEANSGAGNVYVEITRQPEQASDLSSGAGNVTVLLADNVGVYVDATSSMGSAQCAFPLKVTGKWFKKSFEGEINGGGPELRMHAGVGNVALKKM